MCVRLAGNLFKTSDFIQCKKLILAVSGGSDSLALLFLVKDHLKTLSVPPEIIAVTVDHQLRKESAREASIVAEICRAHRIQHVTLRWEGEKPKTHIASSARVARYDLLFQEAQKQGATLIMTGHTLNDQVETYQMRSWRLQKNKNLRGEALESVHDGGHARAFGDVVRGEALESVHDGGHARAFGDVVRGEALESVHDGGYARMLGDVVRGGALESVHDGGYARVFGDVVQGGALESVHDGGHARAFGDVVQGGALESVHDGGHARVLGDVVQAGALESVHDGGHARMLGDVVQAGALKSVHDGGHARVLGDVVQAGTLESVHDGGYARVLGDVVQAGTLESVHDGVYFTASGKNMAQNNGVIAEKNDGLMSARGLSCMAREAVLRGKIRLLRPLLGTKRETLRAYLHFKGTTWIDDPSNENPHFERVRVRQSLHQKKFSCIVQKIHEATRARRQQAQMIADLILALDIMVEYGRCFIAKPAPFLQQHCAFPSVVGLFAVLMGGGCYLLPKQKLITFMQKLCLNSFQKQRFTYAGSVIEYNGSGIALWRESRNMKEAIVAPKTTFLWDGRYQVSNHGTDAIKVGAAGVEELKSLLKQSHSDLEKTHFPSLQSLLMISNKKGYDIPELTKHTVFQQNITIKRIMAPFHWLFSCEDAALVNVLEPFFNLEVKR
nr:tRNA lysidine(34) synthetase TilS [Bartonella raoultii]